MKIRFSVIGMAGVIALMLVVVSVVGSQADVSANAHHRTFSATWFTCEQTPPENLEVTDTYVRFESTRIGQWVSDNPFVSGGATAREKLFFNFERGRGLNRVKADLESNSGGSWNIRAALRLTETDGSGHGFGIGKGDLRGKVILFSIESAVVTPEDNPCSDSTDALLVTGRIVGRD